MRVTLEGNPPFDLIVTGIDKSAPTDGNVEVTLRLSVQGSDDEWDARSFGCLRYRHPISNVLSHYLVFLAAVHFIQVKPLIILSVRINNAKRITPTHGHRGCPPLYPNIDLAIVGATISFDGSPLIFCHALALHKGRRALASR